MKPACLSCGRLMPIHRKAKRKVCSRVCASLKTEIARNRRRETRALRRQGTTDPSHG